MVPVSDDYPLHACRHFLACHELPNELESEGDSIQAFYGRLGVVLLGTVMDGDCGVDTACVMLGLAQTAENRQTLRTEVAAYLSDRYDVPWMHDLLVVTAELNIEDVEQFRSSGSQPISVDLTGRKTEQALADSSLPAAKTTSSAVAEPAKAAVSEPAKATSTAVAEPAKAAVAEPAKAAVAEPLSAGGTDTPEASLEEVQEALKWSTGVKDMGIIVGLMASLPEWSLQEQLMAYRALHNSDSVKRDKCKQQVLIVNPNEYGGRMRVAEAYDAYLRSCGVQRGDRAPRHAVSQFLESRVTFQGKIKQPARALHRWHKRWIQDGAHTKTAVAVKRSIDRYKGVARSKLKHAPKDGRPSENNWVRESLFEWFVAMRYSINWRKYNAALRSSGQHKAMGRFPKALLINKAKEFLQEYLRVVMIAGKKCSAINLDWKWFKRWSMEYGLSLRAPNRKYKVAKWILEERFVIWWLNLARIRALAMCIFEYDPEIENFDQSPFHRNEVGSQNSATLAVKGSNEVPLIEGHSDTRSRWTMNLTTFSNKERIEQGELPYAEFMFKADGQVLLERLKGHLRSCGAGPWVSVATSEKGSYREEDVLEFLDQHLPEKPQWRRWRILAADDFSAHKTDNVFRLAWRRGYILLIHGGGATPVAQTPDTDLNQHVRREYTTVESGHILQEMRNGVVVPRIAQEKCMDLMMKVLKNPKLHLDAADGYKKNGATVALDGTEDHMIVREAGKFFQSLHVREKINREVAIVREEVKAGRLRWTYEDVKSLIQPYPKRTGDDILNANGEHWWLEEDEMPYEDPSAVAETSSEEEEEEKETQQGQETLEASDEQNTHDVEGTAVAVAVRTVNEEQAERLQGSDTAIAGLQQSIQVLKGCGVVSAVQPLEFELKRN